MFTAENKFERFSEKVWLARPSVYQDSMDYVHEAYEKNWMTTAGMNVDAVEEEIASLVGCNYAVALSSGTAAIHMAVKLVGEELYGCPEVGRSTLDKRVCFCSDMTFDATVNPVAYEGGIPLFIDTEYDTWNMDPVALEKAFELYPECKIVIIADLYGVPGKFDELSEICNRHGAVLIEDAAEAFGAAYKGIKAGSLGKYNAISFNGNKIITGTSGGMLLTDDETAMKRVKKWSTQSREATPWYQHEELGYNYRMSNVIAGVARGQIPHLSEHILRKKAIYEKYKEGFKELPVHMNPFDEKNSVPNYWLSCLILDKEVMCSQVRSEREAWYTAEHGKSCPTEILETLAKYNVEGRPIWKPMHMQPIYKKSPFVTREGNGRSGMKDVGRDIFERGLCLPSDINMSEEEQDIVIEIIKRCFE